MISSTSIFIVRWLAPLLFLTSIFLSVFSFVGPVPTTRSVSLVAVTPMNITKGRAVSRRLDNSDLDPEAIGRRVPRASLAPVLAAKVEGASVFIGPLGSCAKQTNAGKLVCQSPRWFPTYSYSFLPDNAPKSALSNSPPNSSPAFYLSYLIMSILFFVISSIASLADILPSAPGFITKMSLSGAVTRALATLGMLAYITGLLTTITWQISFGRDVNEFNQRIGDANGNPALVASLSNGFTLMWIALSFQTPLLIVQFFKLHIQALAPSGKL